MDETVVRDGASRVVIQGQRIFSHKLLYLNFTTYDVCQDQDVVSPSTDRCDIMFVRAPSPGDKAADDH